MGWEPRALGSRGLNDPVGEIAGSFVESDADADGGTRAIAEREGIAFGMDLVESRPIFLPSPGSNLLFVKLPRKISLASPPRGW